MKEFILENKELFLSFVAAVVTGLGTAIGFICRSNVVLRSRLKAAQRQGYTFKCPHCKKEMPLSDISFYLPSGELDNNLNGIPDDKE